MHKVNILGVNIDSLSREEYENKLEEFLFDNKAHLIVTPNPEFCVQASRDQEFRNILNTASLAIPDGVGLKFAGWYLGRPIKERITGVSLVEDLCRQARDKKLSVYFLGAFKDTALRSAANMKKKYPGLKIAGAENEYNFLGWKRSNDNIIKRINRQKPDILFLAFGAPRQEKWLAANLERFTTVKIAVGVGGSFDYLSGAVRRAPAVLRIIGLEWLFRLFRQPWRAKRIYRAIIVFPVKVIISKIIAHDT